MYSAVLSIENIRYDVELINIYIGFNVNDIKSI